MELGNELEVDVDVVVRFLLAGWCYSDFWPARLVCVYREYVREIGRWVY